MSVLGSHLEQMNRKIVVQCSLKTMVKYYNLRKKLEISHCKTNLANGASIFFSSKYIKSIKKEFAGLNDIAKDLLENNHGKNLCLFINVSKHKVIFVT